MTHTSDPPALKLAFGFSFEDLYDTRGLERLDREFLRQLEEPLAAELRAARNAPVARSPKAKSELLIALAPRVEDFIGELFGIQKDLEALRTEHGALHPLYEVKRKFVQKRALTRIKADQAALIDGAAVRIELEKYLGGKFT